MTQAEKDEKLRRIKRLKDDIDSGEISTEQLMTRMLEIQADIYHAQMQHEEDMQPISDFYRSANSIRNGIVWVAGLLAAVGAVFGLMKGFGKELLELIK